ncbi:MAG: hypothetical protein ACM3W4_01690 [Ignavibacteriales bacterium]
MVLVPLTKGYSAIIDAADAEAVLGLGKWHANEVGKGKVYAAKHMDGKRVYLHRYLIGLTDPTFDCDHRNGDGLDCRRSNLRAVSRAVNRRNHGQDKGAGIDHRADGHYEARLGYTYLGRSRTFEGALALRLAAEREAWGVQPQRAHLHIDNPQESDNGRK